MVLMGLYRLLLDISGISFVLIVLLRFGVGLYESDSVTERQKKGFHTISTTWDGAKTL